MSLNKLSVFALLILSAFLASCGSDSDSEVAKVRPDFNNQEVLLRETQKILGDGVRFAYKGFFLPDTGVQIAAGVEIENKDVWGIKFYLLKLTDNKLVNVYESEVLEGSFRESMVKKIKFPDFMNELIYYNSQDYFLGSGGGEVFSYIINFEEKQVYYSHLFSDARTGISLFVSENVSDNLRNFFVSNFRRDYPGLKIAAQDVDLQ